ncbi:MAG: tRNA pseudouridine(38-40) synthase TruA [Acidimicrobiales bacterium]
MEPVRAWRRLRLTVAYDGSGFAGFAAQPGQRTVSGVLAGAIAKVVGEPVALTCAGRTDSGVHAWGQVVHSDVPTILRGGALEPSRLARSCNSMLGPEVVVREASWAAPGFDARRSALSRAYRYQILCGPAADPALAGLAWHLADALDVAAMHTATEAILGEHDFSAFCRRPPDGGSLVRRVLAAGWSSSEVRAGVLVRFDVEASSFCHQMVRSLVGTLIEVGRRRRPAGAMAQVLRGRDRAAAASPAPPQGLCLWAVRYPEWCEAEPSTPEPSKPEPSEAEPSTPEPSTPEPSEAEPSAPPPSAPPPSAPEPS